jgi:uncharacterized protein (TIGR00106 family)
MVLIEFAMSPQSARGESLSPHVARMLDIIDRSGLAYQLTPMGTILEGSWDDVMKVVGDCFRALEPGAARIGMNLKMDYKPGGESRLKSKVEAVERELGRKLRT